MQKGTKIIEQVDLTQRGISEDSETIRESRYRSLRFRVVPLGSRVSMVYAFLLNWKNLQAYVFPPFTLIGPGINQSHSGEMRNNTCWTSLVIRVVLYTTAETGGTRPNLDPTFPISSCQDYFSFEIPGSMSLYVQNFKKGEVE